VVDHALADDGDGLEAAMRVGREAWHRLPEVHAPGLSGTCIGRWWLNRSQVGVPRWIVVEVIGADEKRVDRFPGGAEPGDADDGTGHEQSEESSG